MARLTINGTVHTVFESEIMHSGFEKREIWITEDGSNEKYPTIIEVEFHQGKCNDLDGFTPGDHVQIDATLTGRLWINKTKANATERVFNTVRGNSIRVI